MRKVLIALAIFYTVVLSLNYIIGVTQTPSGYLFLGTVHHPNDYSYYLSQFTQGKTHWLLSTDLFTSEKTPPTLIGFSGVLAGHILSLLTISPIVAYEIALTLYTFLFFLLVIFFLEKVFPKEKEAQCIAFIFLGIANVVPGSGSFFANITEPLTRFPRVPHQMLELICIILSMIIVLNWHDKSKSLFNKCIRIILTIGTSVLLADINPVQWILIVCVMLFSLFIFLAVNRELKTVNRFPFLIHYSLFLIPIIFTLSGLPMIFYVVRIFNTLPFPQLATWESWQQVQLSPVDFLESFGPVFILAMLGLPLFFKRISTARLLIVVYTVTSVALFLSPLSRYAHITNIRFLSAVTIFGESILAALFLTRIPIKNSAVRRAITWMLVFAMSILLVPLFILQFHEHANLDVFNSYTYLSSDAYAAYKQAEKLTTTKDIVLTTWPYDVSFPAVTGRQGFMGHPLLTINSDTKIQDAYHFFDALENDAAMHKFLTNHGITYVLEFTSVVKIIKPFLQVVYQNPLLTLYKVLP